MDSLNWAVWVKDLTKRYGDVRAVDGISFGVSRGEVFGMLGPNGAGKTTTIEILLGLRTADSGDVRVLGMTHAENHRTIACAIGAQLQTTGMYPTHTVRETIQLFSDFYPEAAPLDELIDMVGLREKAGALVKNLSGGQRQRLAIAIALVNRPHVVFLDEPTTGLDPQARRALWDMILSLKASGTTVLLTTHYMEEAEQLCDRVAIVDRGKIVDSPAALINKHFKHIAIEFEAPPGAEVDAHDLRSLPGVANVVVDGGKVTLYSSDVPATMASLLGAASHSLRHMVVRQATLEDVFLKITGRSMRQ
ncbi:MAG TPA: ABC transporter ATP-binding protein [Bacillota bacterium]|nr:ABC transporter ATP-binding protein [Bacillota bacterium]